MQVRTRSSPVALENAMEAIANPRRRQILRLVWDAERSAGEIAAASGVSWPAASQNLRVLKNSGLLVQRRQGTHRYYRAERPALGPLEAILQPMWARDPGRLQHTAGQGARS